MKPLFDAPDLNPAAAKALGKKLKKLRVLGPGRPPIDEPAATPEELRKVERSSMSQQQRQRFQEPRKSGRPPSPEERNRMVVELVRWLHEVKGLSLTYNSTDIGTAFLEAHEYLKKEGISELSPCAIRGRWQRNKDKFA